MNAEQCLERMFQFAREAGGRAMNLIQNSAPEIKADTSVITEADRAISRLAHQTLADVLATKQHILIDEESPEIQTYLDQRLLDTKPYIWAVDPIDGTRLYANRMPLFGISIGLLKDRRPWLGVVYFPALGEMFYCDGEDAYFIQHAFETGQVKTRIVPIDEPLSNRSIFFCSDGFFQSFQWDYKDSHIMVPACAVVDLCWPAVGRGCGSILRCHIWDFAGAWPVILRAGLNIFSLTTGRPLEALDLQFFDTQHTPWKMKDHYLLCSPRNFPLLKNKIIIRANS